MSCRYNVGFVIVALGVSGVACDGVVSVSDGVRGGGGGGSGNVGGSEIVVIIIVVTVVLMIMMVCR